MEVSQLSANLMAWSWILRPTEREEWNSVAELSLTYTLNTRAHVYTQVCAQTPVKWFWEGWCERWVVKSALLQRICVQFWAFLLGRSQLPACNSISRWLVAVLWVLQVPALVGTHARTHVHSHRRLHWYFDYFSVQVLLLSYELGIYLLVIKVIKMGWPGIRRTWWRFICCDKFIPYKCWNESRLWELQALGLRTNAALTVWCAGWPRSAPSSVVLVPPSHAWPQLQCTIWTYCEQGRWEGRFYDLVLA